MQRKTATLLLFGPHAPAAYQQLCQDLSAEPHHYREKEEHKSDNCIPRFVSVKNSDTNYLIISVHPEVTNSKQHKNYEPKFRNALKEVTEVILCPISVKGRVTYLFDKTVSDFAAFQKVYPTTGKSIQRTLDPAYTTQKDSNTLIRFLESCHSHPKQSNPANYFAPKVTTTNETQLFQEPITNFRRVD